jgi:tellurite resistance-related uncharacterized protein
MKKLPANVKSYKKTTTFDEHSIPKGLLQDHSTRPGVWGKIIVLEGSIRYIIQSEPIEKIVLTPDVEGIVEPEMLHYLEPTGTVRLYVAFYK